MIYRNCKVCGDVPLNQKISICGGCMDNTPEIDITPLEIKRLHRRQTITTWLVLVNMIIYLILTSIIL
ncbi:MAG: hypothetical protein V3574_04355 [Candidatus Moraniibacteriota bacterium]